MTKMCYYYAKMTQQAYPLTNYNQRQRPNRFFFQNVLKFKIKIKGQCYECPLTAIFYAQIFHAEIFILKKTVRMRKKWL